MSVKFFWGHNALDAACLFLCRAGVAGLAPFAPGTWGSLLAMLLAPVCFTPLPMLGRVMLLVVLFFLGAFASTHAEKLLQCKDASQIVIDEVLGMWLVFLPFAKVNLPMYVAGFFLFRLFDILKPWPIHAAEHYMPNGYGIMIDDVIAGIMAMLCLAAICWLYYFMR